MISQKAKYGLKALICLAERYGSGPMVISEISAREHLPRKFLEAILLELRNVGILRSRKGKGGGYELSKPPADISLAAILRVIDGPIAPLPCVSINFYRPCEDCHDEGTCRLRRTLIAVRDANLLVLEHTSLAQVVHGPAKETILA